MMHVAERYSGKVERLSTLTREALYSLAAPSTPAEVREPIEELVADAQKFTAADIAVQARHQRAAWNGRGPCGLVIRGLG